jgi:FtsH-binding integral membrane protein
MDTKQTLDVVAVGTTVGTLGEMLPPIAALFTIVWTALRIYETQTIQRMLKRDTGSDDRFDSDRIDPDHDNHAGT